MSFVHVKAPCHRDDGLVSKPSRHERTCVANDRRGGKAWNLGERNAHGVFNVVRKTAKSGSEDYPDYRFCILRPRSDCISALSRSVSSVQ